MEPKPIEKHHRLERRVLPISGIVMVALGFFTVLFEAFPMWGILLVSLGAVTLLSQFFVRMASFSMSGVVNILNAILLTSMSVAVNGSEIGSAYLALALLAAIFLISAVVMWRKWSSAK
jgi:membrane-bound ClpP family serine protease